MANNDDDEAKSVARRYVTPVRRDSMPMFEPANIAAEDEDLFSIPTRVAIDIPAASLHRDDEEQRTSRHRYWWGTGAGALALLVTVGALRATGAQSAPAASNVEATTTISMPAVQTSSEPQLGAEQPAPVPTVIGDGPCRLAVSSTPTGATISVDGIEQGKAPFTVATTCGEHRVDVSHATHESRTVWAVLDRDHPKAVDVILPSRIDSVTIVSKPAGATVYVGGKAVGTTPRRLSVLANSPLNVELRKPGFRTVATQIQTTTAATQVVVRLARATIARR